MVLTENGYRISTLAHLSCNDLGKETQTLCTDHTRMQMAIHQLILYKFHSDVENLDAVLDSCVYCWGIHTTIENVIVPFLKCTGLLSYQDKSCETHFAITAIRRKIIFGFETVQIEHCERQTALLFLQEGEHYNLMLLYTAYLLKRCGIRVLYLGTNVPCRHLKQLIAEKQPQQIYTYIADPKKAKIHELADYITENYSGITLSVVTPEIPAAGNESFTFTTIEHLSASLAHC